MAEQTACEGPHEWVVIDNYTHEMSGADRCGGCDIVRIWNLARDTKYGWLKDGER